MDEATRWEAPKQVFKGWADVQKAVGLVRERGPRAALAEARTTTLYRLAASEGRRFDAAHGVETNELVRTSKLTVRSSDGADGTPDYVPSRVSLLDLALKQLPADLSDFVFIDMGSGKGRMLLAASQHRFNRVVGVEFTEELHDLAERNIAAFRGIRRTDDVRSVLLDAREFELPAEPCVIYIFGAVAAYADLFEALIRKAERSFLDSPRAIYLIMLNVNLDQVMKASPVFSEMSLRGVVTKLVLQRIGAVRIFATIPAAHLVRQQRGL